MVSKARNKERTLARRGPRRPTKHRILIVCEGKKTEPAYFTALQHHFRNRLVHVEINNESGVPSTLVDRAIALRDEAKRDAKAQRDENLLYDEVWCVCDVDEHPRLNESCAKAATNGFSVALSNPCFELWIWLHLRDPQHSIHRHDLQHEVKSALQLKNDKLIPFEKIQPGYQIAVQRARELRRLAASTQQSRKNPSTNVDELTESIRTNGQSR